MSAIAPEVVRLELLHPEETARLRTALIEVIGINPRNRERFAMYQGLLDRLEQAIRPEPPAADA